MSLDQRGMPLVSNLVFTWYLLLLAAHIGFIWWLPYFPTQDGPSHLYNMVILRDLLNGGEEWGRYFEYQLRIVPNMGFTLFAYPLLYFFPALIVEKIFLSIYVILIGTSIPLLLRVLGKPLFPSSFFIFPVIFNTSVMMGFYSYILAIPIFLLSLSVAWSIRDRSIYFRIFSLNALGFLLFCFHIIPFGFFLISLVVMVVIELGGSRERIVNGIISLICIGPSVLIMFLYTFGDVDGKNFDFSYLLSLSRIKFLLADLFFFSSVSFMNFQFFPAIIVMYIIVVVVYFSVKEIIIRMYKQEGIIPSDKFILTLSAFLLILYLFSPDNFFDIGSGSLFNLRFPWVILLVLLPVLNFPGNRSQKKYFIPVIIATVSIFFMFNVITINQKRKIVESYLGGIEAGLPKGAIIMGYKPLRPTKDRVDVLLHAPSYYGIISGCVDVGNYEAKVLNIFPIRFNNSFPKIPTGYQIEHEPEKIEWSEYPAIEYLLTWEADKTDNDRISNYFRRIYERNKVGVWQRIRPIPHSLLRNFQGYTSG